MTQSELVVSPGRALIVLIGLVLVGVIVSAACGLALLPILLGRFPKFGELLAPASFVVAGMGGLFGALLAPAAGFSLLRRVPLGRAVFWTAVGTLIGGVVGIAVGGTGLMLGPLAGFGLAAFRLWTETTELGRRRAGTSKGAA